MTMTGIVSVLNVGDGDTKLSFAADKPEEVKRARSAITDMLKRGFAILVQVGEQDGEPIYKRAKAFDPATDEYIIVGAPDTGIDAGPPMDAEPAPKRKPGRPRKTAARPTRRVKASETRAVAVGRTAGG